MLHFTSLIMMQKVRGFNSASLGLNEFVSLLFQRSLAVLDLLLPRVSFSVARTKEEKWFVLSSL